MKKCLLFVLLLALALGALSNLDAQVEINIGDGTAANTSTGAPAPYGTWYKSFRQQLLYRADDFTAAGATPGLITALGFNVQGLDSCTPMTNFRIRLKLTDQEALTTTFELGDYTTVWQSDQFMPTVAWNLHFLTVPFLWDGTSNLLVEIVTDMVTGAYARNALAFYTPTTYNSSLRAQSDTINTSTSLTGTTVMNRSNIRFIMSPPNPDPQFIVSPPSRDFGDVVLGYTPSQTFSVLNVGGGTLTVNSINISGSPFFSLTDLPTLPAQLVMGQPATFKVIYAPTTAGDHTATITITDNMRQTHTIALTGHGVDTTIYELSYAQGFDEVAIPTLPLGWSSIYQATATTGYVKTVTTSPQSAPNCVAIYNPTDINTTAMLIAPPLANTIPVNNVRVKLWGKGNNYSLKVGVMTNPADATTFTEIETLTFTSAWAPYQVSLGSYTGAGKFIAFKHANNAAGQTIYVDTIEFEMMGANDLAALALSGNTAPSVNAPTQFTLSIFNNGTAAQNTYNVKLYDSNNVELATAAGTPVAAGTTVGIAMSWTPTTAGAMSIYGKVFLAGDINPGNDATAPLNLTVMAEGIQVVEIGNGTATQRFPLGSFFGFERSAAIYTAAEIGAQNTRISAISWYSSIATSATVPTKIYLKTTSSNTLTTDTWANMITGAVLLYDQDQTGLAAGDWNLYGLNSTFDVDQGDNLMILVERNYTGSGSGAAGGSSAGGGIYSTPTPGTHLTWNSDSNPPTGNGTNAANRPNVRLTYNDYTVDTPPNPAVLNSPADAAINVLTNATLNWGGGGGGATSYRLSFGTNNPPSNIENNTDLGNVFTYNPASLNRSTTYYWQVVPYNTNGTATGCPVWSFTTVPEGMAMIGDGAETNLSLPINPFYGFNYSQTLYLQDEIDIPGQQIEKLYYHWNGLADGTNCKDWTIYMGHTAQADFPSTTDWIPFGNLTQVFSGEVTLPATEGWIEIILTMPFAYNNTDNLVIAVNEYTLGHAGSVPKFFGTSTTGYRGLRMQRDGTEAYDPAAPGTGTRVLGIGNIRMQFGEPPTTPTLSVYPEEWDFGTVVVSATAHRNFLVANTGVGTLGINAISITGSAAFTLTDLPTLPASLTYGQTLAFGLDYSPSTAGMHTAVISITDNTTREVHTINVTGNGFDATIYELSHTENFDDVAIPALPMGWSSIYQATATTGYVKTVTASPQSVPNCVAIYNPTDINTIAMLIAPPLANTIPLNELRVKLWGKGNNYSLKVGVMTNSADAATFTEIETLTFTGTWAQYEVSLGAYAGTGKFIAFKHANNAAGQTLYIDTVEFERMGANDLAAIALTGNSSPTVGNTVQFSVSVLNNGTAPQSTYNVKLYNAEDLELATAAGTVLIAPGTTVDVALSWTPTTEGLINIYGKVILAGDINPGNDTTPPLSVTVMPAGLLVIQIGDGTSTNTDTGSPAPYGTWYKSFRQQLLYKAADFYAAGGIPGMISALAFNVQSLGTCSPMTNFTIRLKPTDQEALSTTFETGEYTTVWQSTSFMPATDWNVHTFDQPFFWDGTSNLIVEIVTDLVTGTYTRNALVYYSTTDYASSLRYQSDSINGSTASTGTTANNRSNIRFFMIPAGGDPVFIVNPSSHDFGDVNLGGSRSKSFTIINAGGDILGINAISIAGSGTFVLSNLPTLPASLETAETVTFTVIYTPNSLDDDLATVTITDDQDNRHVISSRTGTRSAVSRDTHTVQLTGSGVNDITIGNGNQTARVPLDFFYKSSLFETIYTIDEMSNFVGMITGVKFYNQFTSNITATPVKIWLGSTNQTDLSADWIPSTQLTQVFDGVVDFPSGQNIINIQFPEQYMHLDGGNLVMMVNRPLAGGYHSSSDLFKTQTVGSNRSREMHSDSTEYDPAAPTGGTVNGVFPQTTFAVIPGGVGHITGTVLGADGSPLAGVQVNVNLRPYATVTDANGQFIIPNVLPNDYEVTFSRHGYVSQTINIVLEEDETELMNVTLSLMAQVSVTGTVLASDTGLGIAGANINLIGYEDYSGSSTGNGSFTIPTVFADHSYAYTISAAGYTSTSGTIDVGAGNYNMGNITLSEIAYAPNSVVAGINAAFNAVDLNWNAPDPNAVEITESFEADTFPPADWSQIITNTNAINPIGVFPTWCGIGTISISGGNDVTPTEGSRQAGLWWDYDHQEEWLFTPSFNCPPDAYLSFDTYAKLGLPDEGHYYVKISSDGGNTWTVLWDAAAGAPGENHYVAPINLDLASYAGMEVKLAFHAEDPPSNDGLSHGWFIDNVYIGNFIRDIRSSSSKHLALKDMGSGTNRLLTGYKVWRLTSGQETNEATWTSLTDDMITTLNYEDPAWTSLPNGTYKWAVKAIYTADVMSVPALSNPLSKGVVTGNIVGFVRKAQNSQGIAGATVSAGPGLIATTISTGFYSLNVPAGIYTVTATATGYGSLTQEDISVAPNQNSTVNFLMVPTSNEDENVPITVTILKGNYPNPFNPETTISYDIKDAGSVHLAVYNVKGQLVRSLVNTEQAAGRYRVIFNGRDDKGNPLSSGIYLYRFTAGRYSSTRKMMLME